MKYPFYVTFFVYPIPDYRGIQKNNWHSREEWIQIVMGEVVKIGRHFEKEIINMVRKYE